MDDASDQAPQAAKPCHPCLRCFDWLTWPRIVLLSVLGAVFVGGYVYLLVPVNYTSEVSILLNEQPDVITSLLALPQGNATGASPGVLGMLGPSATSQRYEQLIRSRSLRRNLVRRYGLAKRYGTTDRQTEAILQSAIDVRPLGRTVGLTISVTCPAGPRLRTWLGQPVAFQPRDARELSAKMANDTVAFLDTYSTASSLSQARSTRAFVEKRRRAVEEELSHTQQRLGSLQRRYRLLSPDRKSEQLSAEIVALTGAHNQAQAQVRESLAALKVMRSRLPAETALRVVSQVTSRNPMIVKLEGELLDLQSRLDALLASGALPGHPDVAELKDTLRAKQAQLKGVAAEVQETVARGANPVHDLLATSLVEQEVMLAAVQGREQILSSQLTRAVGETANLPPVMQEYAHLASQAQIQTDLLGTLVKRLEMAGIEEQRESSGTFQVLDAAETPLHKSGPSTTKSALLAFLGLLVTLGLGKAYRLGWISLDEREPRQTPEAGCGSS